MWKCGLCGYKKKEVKQTQLTGWNAAHNVDDVPVKGIGTKNKNGNNEIEKGNKNGVDK